MILWQYNWKDQVTNIVHKTSGGTVLASVLAGYRITAVKTGANGLITSDAADDAILRRQIVGSEMVTAGSLIGGW